MAVFLPPPTAGVTWTPQSGAPVFLAPRIASSADGTKLAVANYGNQKIYTSTDNGVTWAVRDTAGDHQWFGIASSSDGSKLAAVASVSVVSTHETDWVG
jgi:hypothetical protein